MSCEPRGERASASASMRGEECGLWQCSGAGGASVTANSLAERYCERTGGVRRGDREGFGGEMQLGLGWKVACQCSRTGGA
jgi:hypothetical protein